MKLIRAQFENFRLLRNLGLDFSTDSGAKLTVIRAENETGKTTILNGLQWALYGDDALPGKGREYRLSPIDWDASVSTRIPISVQVDFEKTAHRQSLKGKSLTTTRQYRIIRSVYETLEDTSYHRTSSTVKLFHLTERGSDPIEPPEAWIHEELPVELREVFFTDGDRALSFIEPTTSATTKRQRVEKAIRSLLGLDVIEDALKHVQKTASEVNRDAKRIGSDEKLTKIASELEEIDKESQELENKKVDAKLQCAAFDERIAEFQKEIDRALVKGDRENLKRDIERAKRELKFTDKQRIDASASHSNLFKSLLLSRDLLSPALEKGFAMLNELADQRKIPNETIPILEERLQGPICICGESLDPNYSDGERRRDHIQCLIDESREADLLQSIISTLYFDSRDLQPTRAPDDECWILQYDKIFKHRDELDGIRVEQGEKLKALEIQLDGIPDTNIQELRAVIRQNQDQRDRFNANGARYETLLEALKKKHGSLELQRDNLLREQTKGARILAELDVARDVEHVLNKSYTHMADGELHKVSVLMNTIFLDMIGADPEQGAIIQKAEISEDFEIRVYGTNDRPLTPDLDLNGASRRALTLAFILALTKVSEVEAPNVIDTPLGMMSGYVKKSVLQTAIQESSQLVLFLTRSEIADCEEILDVEAGTVISLTNSAHYPRMLVHAPQVNERKVLRCDCNHREQCQLCQRQTDVAYDTQLVS